MPLAQLPLVDTKVQISRPVEVALESLVTTLMQRARELGQISRGEVVGALVVAAQRDLGTTERQLRLYRVAVVGDALAVGDGSDEVVLPPRLRGRPVRRPAATHAGPQ